MSSKHTYAAKVHPIAAEKNENDLVPPKVNRLIKSDPRELEASPLQNERIESLTKISADVQDSRSSSDDLSLHSQIDSYLQRADGREVAFCFKPREQFRKNGRFAKIFASESQRLDRGKTTWFKAFRSTPVDCLIFFAGVMPRSKDLTLAELHRHRKRRRILSIFVRAVLIFCSSSCIIQGLFLHDHESHQGFLQVPLILSK